MKPIPKISEIYANIQSDLKARLNIEDAGLKTVLDAFASVLAGQFKLSYLYLSDIQNNIFPDTADTLENGGELNRLGQIYLNRPPYPATDGYYIANVVGQVGAVLRAGLTFKSNDNSLNAGKLFVLDNEYTCTGSSDTITIRSLESGLNSSLAVGNQLTITEPVFLVEQTIEIASITTLPISSETTENYRKAIIKAIQIEPQGGAKGDYILWSLDAQGVRDVYPILKENEAGTVQIYVEATKIDSTDGFGTPTQTILDNVESVIELDPDVTKPISERARRPIQAKLEVLPIELNPIEVSITGLQIDTAEIRSSIAENLASYIYEIRPFRDGADLLRNKNDILTSAALQKVVLDTIGNSNYFTIFEMLVNSNIEEVFVFNGSNVPFLLNVSYV